MSVEQSKTNYHEMVTTYLMYFMISPFFFQKAVLVKKSENLKFYLLSYVKKLSLWKLSIGPRLQPVAVKGLTVTTKNRLSVILLTR